MQELTNINNKFNYFKNTKTLRRVQSFTNICTCFDKTNIKKSKSLNLSTLSIKNTNEYFIKNNNNLDKNDNYICFNLINSLKNMNLDYDSNKENNACYIDRIKKSKMYKKVKKNYLKNKQQLFTFKK